MACTVLSCCVEGRSPVLLHRGKGYSNVTCTVLSCCVGEQSRVDHVVFVVHGIGGFHDTNFRSLVDCGK